MKLALDHHYSPRIAAALRDGGHDVVAAGEQGWQTLDDDALLEICHAQQRALLTNDARDFSVIARQRMAEGRSHLGLVFTSDRSWPRTNDTIGVFVEALDRFMGERPGIDELVDQVHWL